jgi:multidrug efflux pump subunit AcrA (membrane-fusion protein)
MATFETHQDRAEEQAPRYDDYEPPPPHKRHSPKLWLLFALALLVAALLVYFVGYLPRHERESKITSEAREREDAHPKVTVAKVQRAPSASQLTIPGTTLAYTEAYIYARASGYLATRLVDIGDRVHTGQLLATIDAPDLDKQVSQGRSTVEQSQSNLAQLQAQLHLNSLTWDRYKVLVAKGVLSRQEGDQQEANYRVSEANVRAAENNIQANRDNLARLLVLQQYERVTAPFDGVITARNVDVGALISSSGSGLGVSSTPAPAGTTGAGAQGNNQGVSGSVAAEATPSTGGAQGGQLFTEARIDILRVLVSVPETYSSAIRVGQRADLTFSGDPNQKIPGKVTRTSASIDQNTRTLLVEIQVANRGGHLLPGMYVIANFLDVQASRPLLIPGEAIVVRQARSSVALVRDNKIHLQTITIGRDYGDQTEVLSGLHEGDIIVPTVTDEIHEGVVIDPIFANDKGGSQQGNASQQTPKQGSGAPGSGKDQDAESQYGDQSQVNKAQKTTSGGGGNGKSQGQGKGNNGGSPGGNSSNSAK